MNEEKKNIVAVVGAGIMGTGIAQRFATFGYHIILLDLSESILEKAMMRIEKNVSIRKMFQADAPDAEDIKRRIHITTDYQELKEADFVIENVSEKAEVKQEVYQKLCRCLNDECYILVNTSCIPITRLAGYMARPDKVIGVHFMNPPDVQKFSEVIKGMYTSEETINIVKRLLSSVAIECTVVNDSPGFVSNRLSHLFMNEAANLVFEGVADAEQIDQIFTEGFGHKMGPLHTADLIGIDTVMQSLQVLYEEYQDSRFRCSPLIKKMYYANKLGMKTKEGFFKY